MKFQPQAVNEEAIELGWWIEIITQHPVCTYYFGDFESREEAEFAKFFYVEELKKDGAEGIDTHIKHGEAGELTDFEDEGRESSVVIVPPTIQWRSRSQILTVANANP